MKIKHKFAIIVLLFTIIGTGGCGKAEKDSEVQLPQVGELFITTWGDLYTNSKNWKLIYEYGPGSLLLNYLDHF
jgi:hypothetical protein